MHRTQISIEEGQYQVLVQEARKSGSSISAIIRGLIDANLRNKAYETSKLNSLSGIAEGSGEAVGRHHNDYLYSKK